MPARVIGSFDELKKSREMYNKEVSLTSGLDRTEKAWEDFNREKYNS